MKGQKYNNSIKSLEFEDRYQIKVNIIILENIMPSHFFLYETNNLR